MITTTSDVKRLGTILSLWAHPDDETFFAAGLMAAALGQGQTVICISATKGEQGVQDESRWPVARLGSIRSREWARALAILGVDRSHCLNYADGACGAVKPSMAVQDIIAKLAGQKIDSLLTFGVDGITGHPDHQAVAGWARQLAQQLGADLYQAVVPRSLYQSHLQQADRSLQIFFQIERPPLVDPRETDIYFHLSPKLQHRKCQALAAHQSQTERFFQEFDQQFWCQAGSIEAYQKAKF